jgi:hypothetical protein
VQIIFDYYNKILDLIPAEYRLPLAILILIFLFFSLLKFLKKNLVWFVAFLLLLPAAYPAGKQIWNIVREWIKK